MKKIILFILIFCSVLSHAFADEPFVMDLSYDLKGQQLTVELERLSRDEVEHFMQRLEIYKEKEIITREALTNQNHLNKITKKIAYQAKEGDIIHVDLYFGQEEVFHKELIVDQSPQQNSALTDIRRVGGSVLVSDREEALQDKIEKEEIKLKDSDIKLKEEKPFGYEDPGKQNYGRKAKEDESQQETYGYILKEEGKEKQVYGYEDLGNKNIGQEKYGSPDYGYKGNQVDYGRTTMSESLMNNHEREEE